MTTVDHLAGAVLDGIAPDAGHVAVGIACEGLAELGNRGYHRGDYDAYVAYQDALYELHFRTDNATEGVRRYVASTTYPLEVGRQQVTSSDAGGSLRDAIVSQQRRLSPVNQPMFRHLFDAGVDRSDVVVYLRQQWLIFQHFWPQFAELGLTLERAGASIEQLSAIWENVWEEMGEGDVAQSHFVRHRARQDSAGIPTHFRQAPDFAETKDYLNTRLRLMRTDVAGALGSIYSQEASAQEYGNAHHAMVVNAGFDQQHADVYADHSEIDVEHCEEILLLMEATVKTAEDQAAAVAGHRAQLLVWHAHMRQVMTLFSEPSPAARDVPRLG